MVNPSSPTPQINAPGNGNRISFGLPDEIGQLAPLSLSDSKANSVPIPFPGVLFSENQRNSLAVHLFPNQPGGRVENVGRDPAVFNVRAVLTNNVYPGSAETWKSGTLFENEFNNGSTFAALYQLLLLPSNKYLNHPVLGKILVQVQSWNYELNPNVRDGVFLDMVLIETIDDSLSQSIGSNLNASLADAGKNLDSVLTISDDAGLSPPGLSIGQFFGQLTNLINQAASFPSNQLDALSTNVILPINHGVNSVVSALITAPSYLANNVLSNIQDLKNSVGLSPLKNALTYDDNSYQATKAMLSLNNTTSQNATQLIQKSITTTYQLQQYYISLNTSQAAPIIASLRQYIYTLQMTLDNLNGTANTSSMKQQASSSIKSYLTKSPISWIALAKLLNNSVDQLLGLNQLLINGNLIIATNTSVQYYG